jgi:streptogramin lyase
MVTSSGQRLRRVLEGVVSATLLSVGLLLLISCARPGAPTVARPVAPTFAEFPLPSGTNGANIAAGPDGNLWFTEPRKIGRITPEGVVTEFPLPPATRSAAAADIVAAPDGNLWFLLDGTTPLGQPTGRIPEIGRITPAGVITEFPTPAGSYPANITAGPDGNLWFLQVGMPTQVPVGTLPEIGRITPAGVITEFPLAMDPHVTELFKPGDIVVGSDGNLWVTAGETYPIARITAAGVITTFPDPTNYGLGDIAAGPDGNLWVTAGGGMIGRFTPVGEGTVFRIPFDWAIDITAGLDGNMWFTATGGYIARITPAGTVTPFLVPTANSHPYHIAAGPDGTLWFTESLGNKIGRFTPPGGAVASATSTTSVPTEAVPTTPAPGSEPTVTPSPYKAPATPSVHEVAQTTTLLGGDTGPALATCPAGERALGGGWSVPTSQARVFAARRTGDAWSVSVQPLGHPASTTITVYVECLANAPGAVVTQRAGLGSAPANTSGVVVATCNSGETLVGGGFDLSAAPTTLELRTDTPQTPESGVLWAIAALNHDPALVAHPVTAYAECLAHVSATPTYPGQQGSYVYAGQTGEIAVACPSGAVPAGGGLDYTAASLGNLYQLQATATGWHGAIYGVTGSGLIPLVPTAWAVCLHFAVQP